MTAPTPDTPVYREDLFPGLTALVSEGWQVSFLLVSGIHLVMAQRGGETHAGVGSALLPAWNHLIAWRKADDPNRV